MVFRRLILPLFLVLSMAGAANHARGQDRPIVRCADMRLDQNVSGIIGSSLKEINPRDADVIVQPRMAGLRGPSITLLGRDVRLAVAAHQTSPQELWHKSTWNRDRVSCDRAEPSGLYWKGIIDNTLGFTTFEPKIMYRSRVIGDALLMQPFGFTFGGAVSLPISNNTESLLALPDPRDPVRRDLARFANGIGLERLYASWRTTPVTDTHLAVSAGYLEEMYGGIGAEIVYRPFGSAFWAGMDGWKLWRRDPSTVLNSSWNDETSFSGHVRAGYDVPDSRLTLSIAAGKYLAGDTGATVALSQGFENGARIEAAMTWTNRAEDEGFFRDTHFDPIIRAIWPLGHAGHSEARIAVRQVGRDGGQMLDRPLPLEKMTETFSGREIIRHWPRMFE